MAGETEQAEADDQGDAVEDDDGAADAELIADEGRQQDRDDGIVVRRGVEEDGLVLAEAEAALEDAGEEVRQRGGDEVQQEEKDGEAVDLGIAGVHEDLGPGELLGLDILAVGVDAGDGERLFVDGQEPEGPVCVLGEVDHPDVRGEPDDDGDETLDEEHVAPAGEAAAAVELVEAEVDDAAGGEDDDLADLQEGEARLLLAARVPGGDEVGEARVDAAHGGAEEHAERDHLLPGLHEGRRHGDDAEGEGDGREPEPRAERAHRQRRRQLEGDRADGEDEDGDAEPVPRQIEVFRQRRHRRRANHARVQQVQRA